LQLSTASAEGLEGIRSWEESLRESGGLDGDRARYVSGNQRREDGRGCYGRVRRLGSEDDAVDPQFSAGRCNLRHHRAAHHGELLLGSEERVHRRCDSRCSVFGFGHNSRTCQT